MTVMQLNGGQDDLFWVVFDRHDDVFLAYDEAKELATKLEQAIQDYETKGDK